MKNQLTFSQYRAIDLSLFALMFAIFEFIIVRVSTRGIFFDPAYTVSLAGAIVSIVYMRWGYWGGIHAALAGLLFTFYYGGRLDQYAIYILGNLLSLLAVPVLLKKGKENVRAGRLSSLVFPLAVCLLMQLGRGLVSLVLGGSLGGATGFFTTDALSIVFTLVIVWIAQRLDGIYEDQKHYLLRIQEEQKQQNEKE